MAELKTWVVLAHLAGSFGYGYALYIEWGTVKAAIMLVIGTLYAVIQVLRFAVRLVNEYYDMLHKRRKYQEHKD